MASKTFILTANVFFIAACLLGPTEPEPIEEPCVIADVEEPCFIADTVGRSAEIDNTDLPCWLFIHECEVYQVCVSRS